MTLALSITDITGGRPAEGVSSVIEVQVNGKWQLVTRTVSDPAGMVTVSGQIVPGLYRAELNAESYFASAGILPLIPRATITFRLAEAYRHSLLHIYIAACSHFSVFVTSDYPITGGGIR
jgi:5-hydroxyisourate hydrolase-like protein (transthyretin family)